MKRFSHKKAGFSPAFTMIELIFVIVVLGILAAVAIPKLAASRDDAVLVKGKSQVSSIRSGIATVKSQRLMQGTPPFVPQMLEGNTTQTAAQANADVLFSGGAHGNILEYGLNPGSNEGQWLKINANNNGSGIVAYDFHIDGGTARFEYNISSGHFNCTSPDPLCNDLTQ